MPNYTQNYNLEKPTEDEFYDVGVQNGNMDKLDETIASIDTAKAAAKNTIADGDSVSIVDSADSSKTKRVLWSTIKSAMGQIFVPLTRKVNNKDLSADISLTGDDIATSATDGTTVSSQLSNLKIKTYTSFSQIGLSGEITPDQLFNALPVGSILIASCGVPNTLSERPTESQYGYIFCYKTSDAMASFEWGEPPSGSGGYGNLYRAQYRTLSNPNFTGWRKLATATKPQEFEMPLAEGWMPIDARYGAVYWKTQESIVNISLSLKSDHTVTDGEIITTLPSGFRPKKSLKIPITVVNQNELLVHGYVDINRSDGTIQIYKITGQINELCFPTTNFLAND